jgi:predicted PhzF superfamily epimerase YddE/YHI9
VRIPIFQVDAFTDAMFAGNPAAVCPLDRWLDDRTLQAIATENNLAETAFLVARRATTPVEYDLRWFTPAVEVDLCGHATLASAWVLFHRAGRAGDAVTFHSKSGPLTVRRHGARLELDFPLSVGEACETPSTLIEGLGAAPREAFRARDWMVVFEREDEIRALAPRMEVLAAAGARGVIATAPGIGADYVFRFFAPGVGVPEDPGTGSAHCTLMPYWARRHGRARLSSRQLSARGAAFACELRGERVGIAGQAVLFLAGTIELPA